VKSFDEGTTERPYPHGLICGVSKPPRQVKRGMDKRTILQKSRLKSFIKVVNYNHVMPTRYCPSLTISYSLDLSLNINAESYTPARRFKTQKRVRKAMQARYFFLFNLHVCQA
jgi:large subunit ribosomal protein L27e